MNPFKFLCICILMACSGVAAIAQNKQEPDVSRATLIVNSKMHDKKAVSELLSVINSIKYSVPDSAVRWAAYLLQLANQSGNELKKTESLYLLTELYNIKGMYMLAEQKVSEGLLINKQLHNDTLLAKGHNALGNTHLQMGRYEDALNSFFKSLAIRKQFNDQKGIAIVLFNISQVYYFMENFSMAKKYADEVLSISDKKDIVTLNALHTKANICGVEGKYDEALALDNYGLSLCTNTNNLNAMSMFYDNMANCYRLKEDYPKARLYLRKTFTIDSTLGNKKQMGDTYANLALLAMAEDKKEEAIMFGRKSLEFTQSVQAPKLVKKSLDILSEIYENYGMYEDAYNMVIAGNKVRDSLFREQTTKQLGEFQILHETEKKESEITRQKLLLQKRNIQMISIAGAVALLAAIAFLLYSRQRLKQDQQREKAIFDTEYKERTRIARDVHDDLGAGLSRISLMAHMAHNKMSKDDEHAASIGSIAGLSKELIDSMRDLIWVLNPENTTWDNLVARIREFCSDYLEEYEISSELQIETRLPGSRISRESSRNIFLTIKEAVHNVVKHASANSILIRIRKSGGFVEVSIQDNGKGFDLSHMERSGDGLRNMKHRIESIGGKYTINSSPSKGTQIEFSIPE